jgi:rubrerythrin
MQPKQITEILLQALEHERGGVLVYTTALECIVNEELKEEFSKYLEETHEHVEHMENVFAAFGLDTEQKSPGRQIVHDLGAALVKAMKDAQAAGDPAAAELVACECVVLAETKDHLNWALLSECAQKLSGEEGKALKAAADEVEDQEDEHLYHSKGWCRELWIESLGMKAILPPMEEQKDVKTAISAAKAEQAADKQR